MKKEREDILRIFVPILKQQIKMRKRVVMNRKNTRVWCRLYPCQEVGARTCSLFRYADSLNHFPFFFSIVYPTEYSTKYSFRSRTFNYTVIQTAPSTWYFFSGCCLHWKVDRNKSFPVYWTWKNLEFTREHLFSLSCATSLVFSVSYTSSTHFTWYRLKFIEQKWFVSRGGFGMVRIEFAKITLETREKNSLF